MNSFLAIDSSTTSIAFAYFREGELDYWGKVNFEGKDITTRLRDAARKTQGLFVAMPVSHVVIESSFYSANPSTATNLALYQGAILGAAAVCGAQKFAKVVPMNWQKSLGNPPWNKEKKLLFKEENPGKSKTWYSGQMRKQRKAQTICIINDRYDIVIADDDVADAIGVGAYVIDKEDKVTWQ